MSVQLYSASLVRISSPVSILCSYWGGTVEFVNNSPLTLSIHGGGGIEPLAANSRVGLAGAPNGGGYTVYFSSPPIAPSLMDTTLTVTWYDSLEKSPYPATEVNTPIPVPSQQGAQYTVYPYVFSCDGLEHDIPLIAIPSGASVHLYGFDVTGPGVPSGITEGTLTIENLYDPVSNQNLQNLVFEIAANATSFIPLQERFPNALQAKPGQLIKFLTPGLTNSGIIVAWIAVY